jgi:2-iminobutanoate/2-iminopropanoate deaminase
MPSRSIVVAFCAGLLVAGPVLLAPRSAPQKPAKRRYINLPNRAIQAPFGDAVLAGDTLYLAGNIGVDPKTGKPPDDAEQETRMMLDHFKAALAEAGMTMDDLVWVQVFCSDISLYDKFNGIYRSYFTHDFPARAFVGSGKLLRGGRFEMNAIAIKR